ncbi:MAG: hypothetical protein IT384_19490 [Deltaproteobacteria bacterium]|nr:hypothetical protein [Deltaproteobacteria bacterium]
MDVGGDLLPEAADIILDVLDTMLDSLEAFVHSLEAFVHSLEAEKRPLAELDEKPEALVRHTELPIRLIEAPVGVIETPVGLRLSLLKLHENPRQGVDDVVAVFTIDHWPILNALLPARQEPACRQSFRRSRGEIDAWCAAALAVGG